MLKKLSILFLFLAVVFWLTMNYGVGMSCDEVHQVLQWRQFCLRGIVACAVLVIFSFVVNPKNIVHVIEFSIISVCTVESVYSMLQHSKLPGNIILKKGTGRSYDEYCLKTKRWIQRLLPSLSVTEKDILRLIAQGLSCKEIADVLHKSEETIKKHRKNLKYKLQTDNQSMAIVFAMNSGLFLIQ